MGLTFFEFMYEYPFQIGIGIVVLALVTGFKNIGIGWWGHISNVLFLAGITVLLIGCVLFEYYVWTVILAFLFLYGIYITIQEFSGKYRYLDKLRKMGE